MDNQRQEYQHQLTIQTDSEGGSKRWIRSPVIMLSTSIDPGDVEKCHTLGCSAYVQKPVDYQHFSDAVHDVGRFAGRLLVPELPGR